MHLFRRWVDVVHRSIEAHNSDGGGILGYTIRTDRISGQQVDARAPQRTVRVGSSPSGLSPTAIE